MKSNPDMLPEADLKTQVLAGLMLAVPVLLMALAVWVNPSLALTAGVLGAAALGYAALIVSVVCVPGQWWINVICGGIGAGFFLGTMFGLVAAGLG